MTQRLRSFSQRRQRDYPLPNRGMRYSELTGPLMRRDVQHAVRTGELIRPSFGLYAPAASLEAGPDVATLQALCRETPHLVSHHTAAVLWALASEDLKPPFHVTSPPAGSRIKRPGLVLAHRVDVPAADRAELGGLPITSPARTWVDAALSLPLCDAVILADRCRREGRTEFGEDREPLASGQMLAEALSRRGRPRGLATARQALELSRDGVDSPMETLLRLHMQQAGLPEPEVNTWICDEHGNRMVQPDLSLRKYRIAIQYEGWEYHSDPHQMAKDIRRQENTEALGWVEVRITKEHMRGNGAAAIAKIIKALRKQGWTPR